MYVVYWERSIRKASWPTRSDRTTKVIGVIKGVIKGGMNEVVSYMDSIVEDNIKTKLSEWHICYTNAIVDQRKLKFTIHRLSNSNRDSMTIHYIAVETKCLN